MDNPKLFAAVQLFFFIFIVFFNIMFTTQPLVQNFAIKIFGVKKGDGRNAIAVVVSVFVVIIVNVVIVVCEHL